jgi:large subunit ribosomal protein L13
MKTAFLSAKEINKKWYVIDATDLVVGRLASQISSILRGKNKATFTPFLDCGDNIIVINAEKVKFTGRKESNKKYYWHTGFPGGIKETTPAKLREKTPEKIIKNAVKRMLSRGPLGRKQFGNFYAYVGEKHPHEGQQPIELNIKDQNSKNNA